MTILIKFTNNFSAPLASGISGSATSITLASGYGASLTNYTGGEYEYLTIYNAAGAVEIVKVTARSGDVLTVTRGEDGTTAQAWLAGDKVASRPCRAAMNDALQVNVAKANVDSQVFTGTPSLPTGTIGVTQTAGDSSTKLATTAFVTPAISSAISAAAATTTVQINAAIAAIPADPSVGVGQTWQDVRLSRSASSVSYQNSTGKPIMVAVSMSGGGLLQVSTNNSSWVSVGPVGGAGIGGFASAVVPNGHYYRTSGTASALADYWAELR